MNALKMSTPIMDVIGVVIFNYILLSLQISTNAIPILVKIMVIVQTASMATAVNVWLALMEVTVR